jgi:biotin transporter BioY
MNIFITAAIVFGAAARKFWSLRTKWTFWTALCVLSLVHFALLSRLHWQQAGYFWLPLVAGIPELALVIFVLRLAFDPLGNLTKPKSW